MTKTKIDSCEIVRVPLEVTMVGHSSPLSSEVSWIYLDGEGEDRDRDYADSRGLSVLEVAGRGCYEAYGRKNEKTDSFDGYVKSMLEQKHYSVLEHVSISIHLKGISRAASHEIVRHRHFSFSQQSQRYRASKTPYEVALHPELLKHYKEEELMAFLVPDFVIASDVYDGLRKKGLAHKQASEAARAFLPNAAATHMVVTGNLRSWIEFVSKRDHPAADLEMQEIAKEVHRVLNTYYPEAFDAEARALWDENFAQKGVRNDR